MPANKSPETRAGSVPPHAPQSTPAANAEISARAQRAILSIQASLVQARDAVRSYQKDLAAELAQDGLDSPEAIEAACRAEPRANALYCVPTMHNPTAATMPLAQ